MNWPAAGVTTRRPEEPYAISARTVLWEALRVTGAPTRCVIGMNNKPEVKVLN